LNQLPQDAPGRAGTGRGPSTGDDDAARIDGYRRGDPDVFSEVDRWIRIELRHRYPGLLNEHEDLCQTVHQKLLKNIRADRYAGRSTLRTYVTGITQHTAIDRVREIRRQRDGLAALTRVTVADRATRPGVEPLDPKLLHQVLLALPAACRELWRLVFVENLGYQEIGRRLSVPGGTVKSRMWHCKQKAMFAVARLRRVAAQGKRK